MVARLQVDKKELQLTEDTIAIGREGEFFQISDFTVSRKHFNLVREKNTYRIYDLQSKSGTVVNGERVGEHGILLPDFARIQCGHTLFKYLNDKKVCLDDSQETEIYEFEEISTRKILDGTGPGTVLIYQVAALFQESKWSAHHVKMETLKLIATFLRVHNVVLLSADRSGEHYEVLSCYSSLEVSKDEKIVISKKLLSKCLNRRDVLTATQAGSTVLCIPVSTQPTENILYLERLGNNAFQYNEQMLGAAVSKLITFAHKEQRLREQIERSQKLEMIGTVAAGVVHSFNNIFNGIIGNFELLKEELPESAIGVNQKEYLDNIEQGLQDAMVLTQDILGHIRGIETRMVPLDLLRLINSLCKIYRPLVPKSIDFKPKLPKSLWQIEGNDAQLTQAVLNLLQNAVDAMPDGGQLTLQVTVACSIPKKLDKSRHYAKIIVADTGMGMDEYTLQRIFTPFFTTKEDIGTGLGLSYTLAVVERHHGCIDVKSQNGQGTKFLLYLPMKGPAESLTTQVNN